MQKVFEVFDFFLGHVYDILFFISVLLLLAAISVYFYSVLSRFNKRPKKQRKHGRDPKLIAFILVVLSVFCYSLIGSYAHVYDTHAPFTQTLLLTLESFTFALEAPQSPPALSSVGIHISDVCYYALGNALYIAASLTTLGAIVAVLYKRLAIRTLRFTSRFVDTYVFSRATKSSITLAESIRNNYVIGNKPLASGHSKHCQILFADANLDDDQLLDDINEAGFTYVDISTNTAIEKCRCRNNSSLHVILSSENETENLQKGLRVCNTITDLLDRKKIRTKPTVHVLSSSSAAESYIDQMFDKINDNSSDLTAVIRRIDWTSNVVYQILMRYPLFLTAPVPQANNSSQDTTAQNKELYTHTERRIVIVGAGNTGYEFLKGTLWCSKSLDVTTYIDVIDVNAKKIKSRAKLQAPEIFEDNGEHVDVRFRPIDVNTAAYLDYLLDPSKVEDENSKETAHDATVTVGPRRITYMFFSLGDDLLNTEVAKRTREVLEEQRLSGLVSSRPFIALVVDDERLAQSITTIENSKRQSYDLVPVGDEGSIFTYDNVFNPPLENMGVRLNRAYYGCYGSNINEEDAKTSKLNADKGYNQFEYNRRSSRASAVFLLYHLYEFCRALAVEDPAVISTLPPSISWTYQATECEGAVSLTSPAFAHLLAKYDEAIGANAAHRSRLMELEHLRWNSYMCTDGFRTCDKTMFERVYPETKTDQHQLARLHICLAPYAELPEIDNWHALVMIKVKVGPIIKSGFTPSGKLAGYQLSSIEFQDVVELSVLHVVETLRNAKGINEPGLLDALVWLTRNCADAFAKAFDAAIHRQLRSFGTVSQDSLQKACEQVAVIASNKDDHRFQYNDEVIIRNLRTIVCGDSLG